MMKAIVLILLLTGTVTAGENAEEFVGRILNENILRPHENLVATRRKLGAADEGCWGKQKTDCVDGCKWLVPECLNTGGDKSTANCGGQSSEDNCNSAGDDCTWDEGNTCSNPCSDYEKSDCNKSANCSYGIHKGHEDWGEYCDLKPLEERKQKAAEDTPAPEKETPIVEENTNAIGFEKKEIGTNSSDCKELLTQQECESLFKNADEFKWQGSKPFKDAPYGCFYRTSIFSDTIYAQYNTTKDLYGKAPGGVGPEKKTERNGALCKSSGEKHAATTDVSLETIEVDLNEIQKQFTAEKNNSETELAKATQQKDDAKKQNAAANIEKVESEKELKKKLDENTAEQAVLQSGLIQNSVKAEADDKKAQQQYKDVKEEAKKANADSEKAKGEKETSQSNLQSKKEEVKSSNQEVGKLNGEIAQGKEKIAQDKTQIKNLNDSN